MNIICKNCEIVLPWIYNSQGSLAYALLFEQPTSECASKDMILVPVRCGLETEGQTELGILIYDGIL